MSMVMFAREQKKRLVERAYINVIQPNVIECCKSGVIEDCGYSTTANGWVRSYRGEGILEDEKGREWLLRGHGPRGNPSVIYSQGFIEIIPRFDLSVPEHFGILLIEVEARHVATDVHRYRITNRLTKGVFTAMNRSKDHTVRLATYPYKHDFPGMFDKAGAYEERNSLYIGKNDAPLVFRWL